MTGYRLILGDVLEAASELEDRSIDLVVTSPPYAEQRVDQYGGISETDFPRWCVSWFAALEHAMKPTASLLVNIRPHLRGGQIADYMLRTRLELRAAGWLELEELIWHKTNAPPLGALNRPRRAWESIHWFARTADPWTELTANGAYTARKGLTGGRGQRDGFVGAAGTVTSGRARQTDVLVAASGAGIDRSEWNDHPAQYPKTVPRVVHSARLPARRDRPRPLRRLRVDRSRRARARPILRRDRPRPPLPRDRPTPPRRRPRLPLRARSDPRDPRGPPLRLNDPHLDRPAPPRDTSRLRALPHVDNPTPDRAARIHRNPATVPLDLELRPERNHPRINRDRPRTRLRPRRRRPPQRVTRRLENPERRAAPDDRLLDLDRRRRRASDNARHFRRGRSDNLDDRRHYRLRRRRRNTHDRRGSAHHGRGATIDRIRRAPSEQDDDEQARRSAPQPLEPGASS